MSNVPKLRFKEFSGEWEETILKNISTFYNGRAYKQAELLSSGKYTVLRVGNFFTNDSWYYSDLELDENKYCDNGDLLYAWSASFGPKIWKGEKVIYHYHIWKVVNHNEVTKKYLYILLDNETAKMKSQSANGFALLHITKGTIENWKVNLPSLPEQTKIASFLTSVDTKIEQLTKKETLLKEYKKGVMAQIFNQEIRFKAEDGSEFAPWEEKKLEDLLVRTSTGLNPRQNFVLGQGSNYYVTIKNIKNGKLNFSSCEMIDDKALIMIHKRSQIQKDDIIMSSIGNIGESYLIEENPINWDINESVFMLRPNSVIVPSYLYYIITSYKSRQYFENNSTGSSFTSIKLNTLKIMPVTIPSKPEQTKIANFLSSIDTKIEFTTKELSSTKEFKKALLQQMFV